MAGFNIVKLIDPIQVAANGDINNNYFNNFKIDQSGGTSDTYGVLAGSVNGSNTVFTVSNGSYTSGSVIVYLNGQLQTQGSSEDYSETTPASGTITFATAPPSGSEITVLYQYQALSTFSVVTNEVTGWANYVDSTYTSGSPLSLAANTDTQITNDAAGAATNETQMPTDLTAMYNPANNTILGVEGDAYTITIDLKFKPTSVSTTRADFWFDIGGSVGELYRRTVSFPKGNGVEVSVTFTTTVYTLDTWEANGAELWCNSVDTADIYGIRFIIFREHKAR